MTYAKAGDTWGTILTTPPPYYIASDATTIAVSKVKEAIDLAMSAWGNYGPAEIYVMGSDRDVALQMETDYESRHKLLDPNWQHGPISEPGSPNLLADRVQTNSAGVSIFRLEGLDYHFQALVMGNNNNSDRLVPVKDIIYGETYQRIVMHEWFHVFQQSRIAIKELYYSSNTPDVHGAKNPLYMGEGGANWMALKLYDNTHDMRGDYVQIEMKKYLTGNDALNTYKANGVLLQNITYGTNDTMNGYAIGAWYMAYLEHKVGDQDVHINFYDELDSLGFEAAFLKTYGKSSTDYLAEFEIFINQPIDEILKIIPSTSTAGSVTEKVNVVVTTLGDLGADIFRGTTGNDLLYGNAGNDTIFADGGSDTIQGGAGLDTIKYALSQANYTLAVGESSSTVKEISIGTNDSLSTVERVVFSDKAVALDIGSGEVGGSCYRIYKAAFNRTPDGGGLGYWIGQMDLGKTLVEVSAGFIDSDEFRASYGTNPSNGEFLTKVYNNVLGRDPDSGGYDWWVDQLANNPAKSWSKVMADFSEGTENQANVLELIGNGVQYDLWVA